MDVKKFGSGAGGIHSCYKLLNKFGNTTPEVLASMWILRFFFFLFFFFDTDQVLELHQQLQQELELHTSLEMALAHASGASPDSVPLNLHVNVLSSPR